MQEKKELFNIIKFFNKNLRFRHREKPKNGLSIGEFPRNMSNKGQLLRRHGHD